MPSSLVMADAALSHYEALIENQPSISHDFGVQGPMSICLRKPRVLSLRIHLEFNILFKPIHKNFKRIQPVRRKLYLRFELEEDGILFFFR